MTSQGQVPTLSGRRPWINVQRRDAALKGRNKYFGLSGLDASRGSQPGATRFALASGCHIPGLWRCVRPFQVMQSFSGNAISKMITLGR
jgi:hypothetical protein